MKSLRIREKYCSAKPTQTCIFVLSRIYTFKLIISPEQTTKFCYFYFILSIQTWQPELYYQHLTSLNIKYVYKRWWKFFFVWALYTTKLSSQVDHIFIRWMFQHFRFEGPWKWLRWRALPMYTIYLRNPHPRFLA